LFNPFPPENQVKIWVGSKTKPSAWLCSREIWVDGCGKV